MKKSFNINKTQSVYGLLEYDDSLVTDIEDRYSSNTQNSESSNKLFISKKARDTIFEHIGWSVDIDRNSVEQGGIIIGHSYLDEKTKDISGIAVGAIPATTAKGSMAYLEFDHNTWKLMIDELDLINENNQESELQVIGWYHTHPGRLSVFMSSTDLNTQRKMFSMEWQFAIVLNPQKEVWRAFNGSEAKECNGYMLKY